jgi:hypothetical protein
MKRHIGSWRIIIRRHRNWAESEKDIFKIERRRGGG